MDAQPPSVTVDARGLDCPMPLLKAKLALNGVGSGECVEVLATDPGSRRDFRSFCELSGHELLAESAVDGVFQYLLRKR